MTIQVDTREKARAIEGIIKEFDKQGVTHFSSKLYVGDYVNLENSFLVVDRKQNLLEVCSNVCQQHKRFVNEIKRAKAAGIKIIFLVEHGKNIKSLEDVKNWVNPRLKESPLAVSGERLYKILSTLERRYGVEFRFCDKRNICTNIDSGRRYSCSCSSV